jgi:outer membrane biosynthesis protein TonB
MEIKSFFISPIAKILIVSTLIVAVVQHQYIGEKINQAKTFIAKKINTVKDPDGFNETSFSSREAEVAYIREYIEYKTMKAIDKQNGSSNVNLENLQNAFTKALVTPTVDAIMREVIRQDMSITQVKEKFKEKFKEFERFEAQKELERKELKQEQAEYRERQEKKYQEEARKYEINRGKTGRNEVERVVVTTKDALHDIMNGNENNSTENNTSLSSNDFKGTGSGYGTGSSSGGSSGFSLGNRKAISKPAPKYTCDESGKVVVEVIVDRNGNTIVANAGIKGSTTTASCLLDQARIAAMNTRWEASSDAPERQVGRISYNFNLN